MCARTRLNADEAGRSAAKNSNSFARLMRLRITTAPAAFTPWI
jgi:hypothetical protein